MTLRLCYGARWQNPPVRHNNCGVAGSVLAGVSISAVGPTGALAQEETTRALGYLSQENTARAVVVESSSESGLRYSTKQPMGVESSLEPASFNRTADCVLTMVGDSDATTIRHALQSKDDPVQTPGIVIDNEGAVAVEQRLQSGRQEPQHPYSVTILSQFECGFPL